MQTSAEYGALALLAAAEASAVKRPNLFIITPAAPIAPSEETPMRRNSLLDLIIFFSFGLVPHVVVAGREKQVDGRLHLAQRSARFRLHGGDENALETRRRQPASQR